MRVRLSPEIEVSVIDDGYGGQANPFEVALYRNGEFWHGNPIITEWTHGEAQDVIGWMTAQDVGKFVAFALVEARK